jgi:hypothetical protein
MKSTLVIFLFLCSGCALTSAEKKINYEELNDQKFKTSDEYFRKTAISIGSIALTVHAAPITGRLISLLEHEYGSKNLDTESIIQEKVKEQESALIANKICFKVTLNTVGNIESSKFVNYRTKLKIGEILTEGKFSNIRGVDSIPQLGHVTALGTAWKNEAMACFPDTKISSGQKITLVFIPQLKKLENISLTWDIK